MRGEFIDLADARLYYYAAGTRGAGDPVVFLHGFPTSGHLWSDVVPLVPRGHRVVVVDLLGYGRSDRPLKRRVDIRAHAARTIALLDDLRIPRACLVGHGIGGGIAQSIAVRHADRVSHLALVDSVAFDRWPGALGRLARAALPTARLLPPDALLALLRREMTRGYADPARAARSIDQYLRVFAGVDGRAALVAHVRALTSRETSDLAARLGAVRAPTAILCGGGDRIVRPAIARRLAAAIPGATLDIIAGAGHFTPEEAPRPVAEALARLLAR